MVVDSAVPASQNGQGKNCTGLKTQVLSGEVSGSVARGERIQKNGGNETRGGLGRSYSDAGLQLIGDAGFQLCNSAFPESSNRCCSVTDRIHLSFKTFRWEIIRQ